MILHITSKSEWAAAQTRGEYSAPSLQTEGFIHCSTEDQVLHLSLIHISEPTRPY